MFQRNISPPTFGSKNIYSKQETRKVTVKPFGDSLTLNMVATCFPETPMKFSKLKPCCNSEILNIQNLTFLQKGPCTLLPLKSVKLQPLSACFNRVSVSVTESRGNLTGH
jgi:hypothetical protein